MAAGTAVRQASIATSVRTPSPRCGRAGTRERAQPPLPRRPPLAAPGPRYCERGSFALTCRPLFDFLPICASCPRGHPPSGRVADEPPLNPGRPRLPRAVPIVPASVGDGRAVLAARCMLVLSGCQASSQTKLVITKKGPKDDQASRWIRRDTPGRHAAAEPYHGALGVDHDALLRSTSPVDEARCSDACHVASPACLLSSPLLVSSGLACACLACVRACVRAPTSRRRTIALSTTTAPSQHSPSPSRRTLTTYDMPCSVGAFPDAPGCKMLGILKPVDCRRDSAPKSGGQQPCAYSRRACAAPGPPAF